MENSLISSIIVVVVVLQLQCFGLKRKVTARKEQLGSRELELDKAW